MKTNNNTSLFQRDQVMESLKQSFVKLNPKIMVKNPVMFTVEISTLIMFIVTLFSATNDSQGSFAYNLFGLHHPVGDFAVCQFRRGDCRSSR